MERYENDKNLNVEVAEEFWKILRTSEKFWEILKNENRDLLQIESFEEDNIDVS